MSRKIGIPIQPIHPGETTSDCDIVSRVPPQSMDPAHRQISTPYFTYPLVIATNSDALYINDLETVADKPIAVSARALFFDEVTTRYPHIQLIPVDTVEQGLFMIRSKEVFGLVDTAPVIGYHIQKNQMFDLKISRELPFQVMFQAGIRTGDPLLYQIVEKAIHSVTPGEKHQIFQNWMTLTYERGFDYALLWKILLAIGIVGTFAVYRHISITRYNPKLGRLNRELTRANEKLEAMSYLDGLTEIPNRRKFDAVLADEWKRCERNRLILTLLMLDIDYFKPFNDRYGHLQGDDCLKQVAKTVESLLGRPGDFVARYGGEEFGIILPGADPAGAEQMAQKILARIQELKIPNQDSGVSPWLTVSIGAFCAVPNRILPVTWFIDKADQQLYRAKEGGRNQYRLESL